MLASVKTQASRGVGSADFLSRPSFLLLLLFVLAQDGVNSPCTGKITCRHSPTKLESETLGAGGGGLSGTPVFWDLLPRPETADPTHAIRKESASAKANTLWVFVSNNPNRELLVGRYSDVLNLQRKSSGLSINLFNN